MGKQGEPMERRSQLHLKALRTANERYYQSLKAGDSAGVQTQLEISASHYMALCKETPAAFY